MSGEAAQVSEAEASKAEAPEVEIMEPEAEILDADAMMAAEDELGLGDAEGQVPDSATPIVPTTHGHTSRREAAKRAVELKQVLNKGTYTKKPDEKLKPVISEEMRMGIYALGFLAMIAALGLMPVLGMDYSIAVLSVGVIGLVGYSGYRSYMAMLHDFSRVDIPKTNEGEHNAGKGSASASGAESEAGEKADKP